MATEFPLNVAGLISVWFETLLYGMYCTLFSETVYIIVKKKKIETFPSKIFFGATLLMFVVATLHIGINLYRLLKGYVWLADDPGPAIYFADLTRWETITHDAINAVMTWIGDFLVIYRCFIVWDNNVYVIVLPALLLIMSIIANSIALHEFTQVQTGAMFSPRLVHWMNTIYSLAFTQNFMTTGLITYRIWNQHHATAHIEALTSTSTLVPVIRIIVESAMIYVLEVLLLIIFYASDSNGQYVVQEAIVPTVGIVFTMMSVRIAMRSSKSLMTTSVQPTVGMPLEWRRGRMTEDSGAPTLSLGMTSTEIQLELRDDKMELD